MAKSSLNFNQILPQKKCRKCDKLFIPAPMHRYKHGKKYYCSWTCYNHRNDMEATKKDDKGTT